MGILKCKSAFILLLFALVQGCASNSAPIKSGSATAVTGTSSETLGRPFVDIKLSATKRHLLFEVKNSTEPCAEQHRTYKENIGLSNLRRQLALLYTDYQLSAQQGAAEFITRLSINLSSHV